MGRLFTASQKTNLSRTAIDHLGSGSTGLRVYLVRPSLGRFNNFERYCKGNHHGQIHKKLYIKYSELWWVAAIPERLGFERKNEKLFIHLRYIICSYLSYEEYFTYIHHYINFKHSWLSNCPRISQLLCAFQSSIWIANKPSAIIKKSWDERLNNTINLQLWKTCIRRAQYENSRLHY